MLALLCNNALFRRWGNKKVIVHHRRHLRLFRSSTYAINATTDMSITLHELIRHECSLAFEFKDDINDPLESWRHQITLVVPESNMK